MTFEEAGQMGGFARSRSCTKEQIREWGRKGGLVGGRPRLKTLEELLAMESKLKTMSWWR
jgi:general stress protein YciG